MCIKIKNLILDILFPKFCFNCEKEGNYLCQDCQELLEISGFHRNYSTQNLDDLYFAVDYKNPLIKKLIQRFKYEPFVKELAKPLSYLIITHFQLMDNKPNFLPQAQAPRASNGADFILIPVPLDKKRLRWRGFNQAEELSKELAKFLKIPLIPNSQAERGGRRNEISSPSQAPAKAKRTSFSFLSSLLLRKSSMGEEESLLSSPCLTKIKETFPQIKLSDQERKENVRGVFLIKDRELIKNKNILLVDDVYTTGATMEECAMVLKKAGTKKIIGVVVARG